MKSIYNKAIGQVILTLEKEEFDALHYALNQYSQTARGKYLTWSDWYDTLADEEDRRRESIIEDLRSVEYK